MFTFRTLVGLLFTCIASTQAAAMSPQEIVNRTSVTAYYQGKDGKAQVHMTITDAQSRERSREFTILRTDVDDRDNNEQKFYVQFNRPADVNRTVFMVWKHAQKDDDRWLYLPALDLVRRIAANNGRSSFVGSHFFYEDVSGRSPTADTHTLADETDQYYVIESVPIEPHSVEFTKYITWIEKNSFVPVETKYYNAGGEHYRTYTALKVDNIEGWPTVVKSRMQDLHSGGETVLSYQSVDYDIGLPKSIFTERYLRNPPSQFLH
jgi:hypothetical protein